MQWLLQMYSGTKILMVILFSFLHYSPSTCRFRQKCLILSTSHVRNNLTGYVLVHMSFQLLSLQIASV